MAPTTGANADAPNQGIGAKEPTLNSIYRGSSFVNSPFGANLFGSRPPREEPLRVEKRGASEMASSRDQKILKMDASDEYADIASHA